MLENTPFTPLLVTTNDDALTFLRGEERITDGKIVAVSKASFYTFQKKAKDVAYDSRIEEFCSDLEVPLRIFTADPTLIPEEYKHLVINKNAGSDEVSFESKFAEFVREVSESELGPNAKR